MSIIGGMAAWVLRNLVGLKAEKNGWGWVYRMGHGWGGISLGPVAIVEAGCNQQTLDHEFGHSLQNAVFGPLFIILIFIPSGIRYWYRRIFNIIYPSYDAIWFEGTATKYGIKVKNFIKNSNL